MNAFMYLKCSTHNDSERVKVSITKNLFSSIKKTTADTYKYLNLKKHPEINEPLPQRLNVRGYEYQETSKETEMLCINNYKRRNAIIICDLNGVCAAVTAFLHL